MPNIPFYTIWRLSDQLFFQIIPLHLPPGDTSTERNVYIDGSNEQIDSAKDFINEVISGVSEHDHKVALCLVVYFCV